MSDSKRAAVRNSRLESAILDYGGDPTRCGPWFRERLAIDEAGNFYYAGANGPVSLEAYVRESVGVSGWMQLDGQAHLSQGPAPSGQRPDLSRVDPADMTAEQIESMSSEEMAAMNGKIITGEIGPGLR